jgi:hypothetical protein
MVSLGEELYCVNRDGLDAGHRPGNKIPSTMLVVQVWRAKPPILRPRRAPIRYGEKPRSFLLGGYSIEGRN